MADAPEAATTACTTEAAASLTASDALYESLKAAEALSHSSCTPLESPTHSVQAKAAGESMDHREFHEPRVSCHRTGVKSCVPPTVPALHHLGTHSRALFQQCTAVGGCQGRRKQPERRQRAGTPWNVTDCCSPRISWRGRHLKTQQLKARTSLRAAVGELPLARVSAKALFPYTNFTVRSRFWGNGKGSYTQYRGYAKHFTKKALNSAHATKNNYGGRAVGDS